MPLPASESVEEFLADGQAVLWGADGAGLMRSDGRRTPIDAAGGVVVSPGGARAAWLGPDRVLRLGDGSGPVGVEVALPPGEDECRVMAWIDTTSVLVSCMPADEGAAGGRFITVDVDAGTTTQVPITADMATWGGHGALTAGSGGVLYTGSVSSVTYCGQIQEWSAGTTRTFLPLTGVSELWGLGGGEVWFGTARTCTEIAPTSVEVVHADGTVTTVIAEDKDPGRVMNVAGVSVAQP
ncbi:MAG: hypothetical protein HGA44_16770 [Cellulomonadaceae bacterium]|nr:hypothetical protein [Cellulomonadaceae bacterium]